MNISDLLQASKQLITIPSTANNPQALQAALAVIKNRLGSNFTIEHFEQNNKPSILAYYGAARPDRFRVLLNGHVDIVPALKSQFAATIQDDKLYGRGALDMKVAALVLTEVFCELAPQVDYPLGLQIVTDEEIGGKDGTAHQVAAGVRADFVICGEFTPASTICTHSRGICTARVTCRGTSAHSAYAWNGDNAVVRGNHYITKLLKAYPTPKNDAWVTTVNVASLTTANQTFNRVPDQAEILLDIRYVPEDTRFTNLDAAQTWLDSLHPGCTSEIILYEPAHTADHQDPTLQLLKRASQTASGKPVKFIKKHGAADARYFSATGTAAVIYGIEGEGLHGDHEYAFIPSIDKYHKTLTEFLRTI